MYQNNDKNVVTNIDGYIFDARLSKDKMNCIDNSNYVNDFGKYCEFDLYKISNIMYRRYMELIVTTGEILILNEPEAYLNTSQVYDLCNSLCQLKDYWKKIIISDIKVLV